MNKSYKADIYRINIETDPNNSSNFYLDINDVISWDSMILSLTKEELVGLMNFIKHFLEDNNDKAKSQMASNLLS